jgi:hypothetical protein
MYYIDEVKNAELAIDCFELVLKKSNVEEELMEASMDSLKVGYGSSQ